MDYEPIVDKTLAMLEFLQDLQPKSTPVHILLRPRRSGKSMLLHFTSQFLQRGDPGDVQDRRKYFADLNLAIAKDENAVEKHFSNHIVLLLDLTNVVGTTMADLQYAFVLAVRNAVASMQSSACFSNAHELDEPDADFLRNLLTSLYTSYAFNAETILSNISRIVRKLSHRPLVFMVDEYDSPIACAAEHGFHEEAVNFFRQAIGAFLKDNDDLEGALIIGIMRFGDNNGYLSEVGNVKVFTLRDKRYTNACMFTADETRELLDRYRRRNDRMYPEQPLLITFEDLNHWYKGYYDANGARLYNPWSVMNALREKMPRSFWLMSGSDKGAEDRILELIDKDDSFKAAFEALVAGEPWEIELDGGFTFALMPQLMNRLQMLTFIYYAGYLTPVPSPPFCESTNSNPSATLTAHNVVTVAIPSYEIWVQYSLWLEAGLVSRMQRNSTGQSQSVAILKKSLLGSMTAFVDLLSQFIADKKLANYLGNNRRLFPLYFSALFTAATRNKKGRAWHQRVHSPVSSLGAR
ncbi:hypothetical protein FA95DRAFT_1125847 [Auriscalpium vulgare]|uniref:Uncharacterized protein n=1 Tax=Auriscalpium vulgare TaxID=40419 RepID=A0ACB8RVP0_9AGAM|nr:hypothetical protein FA95DRAFT_1125847 [Auriscalpium vulgare]